MDYVLHYSCFTERLGVEGAKAYVNTRPSKPFHPCPFLQCDLSYDRLADHLSGTHNLKGAAYKP